MCLVSGDEFGIGPRAEAHVAWHRVGRNELENAQSVLSVRDERKHRGVHRTNLNCARIIQCAVRVEHLNELRLLGILNVNYRESLRAFWNVRVSASNVESACL